MAVVWDIEKVVSEWISILNNNWDAKATAINNSKNDAIRIKQKADKIYFGQMLLEPLLKEGGVIVQIYPVSISPAASEMVWAMDNVAVNIAVIVCETSGLETALFQKSLRYYQLVREIIMTNIETFYNIPRQDLGETKYDGATIESIKKNGDIIYQKINFKIIFQIKCIQ